MCVILTKFDKIYTDVWFVKFMLYTSMSRQQMAFQGSLHKDKAVCKIAEHKEESDGNQGSAFLQTNKNDYIWTREIRIARQV